uniref:hypothetical protein n=1 Tax=uncultured Bacteroides sp. TaxID=162156 RepID=UPI00280C021F|nr:hypothetical protein [uncultured Bacteroides sp.]
MKYLYQLLIVLLCSVNLISCGEDDFLEIDSLSADGNEFFCNQKVKLWMCVNSSDLWHTTYQWDCEGGILTQPQGLNEMTWKAPSVPGTYTITCKATVGDVSQVRTHQMYVSSYYFEKFEKSSHSFSLQSGNTNSLKKEANGNQYLQVRVNSSSEVKRYARRSFGDESLYTPFSTRMKLGFESNIPNTQRIKVGTKEENAVLEYRWNLRSDASNGGSYLNQIRLLWYPSTPTDGYPTSDAVVEGTPDYNVQLIVQYTADTGKKTTYNEYRKLNTLNVFKVKEYKNVSMSVDENEMLRVYVDGAEALTSDLVKNVRSTNNCEGRIAINNWEFYFINGNGGKNIPLMYIDDAYASNTEILK